MTILYILLFIVCLSTLIMVHEAGHLATAKIFKVYCFEYAIGFGPKLFSFKRKGGETAFSLRAIPFGGFVSMYGEEESLPEGHEPIDASRSLNNIKKWKKCIILSAGVVMNFILAIVIFFVYEIAYPSYTARVGHIMVAKGSIAYEAGLRNYDYVYTPILQIGNADYIFYDDNATLTYQDSSTRDVYFGYNYSNITLKNQSLYSYSIAFNRINLGHIDESITSISYEEALNNFELDSETKYELSGYLRASGYKKEKSTGNYIYNIALTENYLDTQEKVVYVQLTLTKDEFDEFKYVPVNSYISFTGNFTNELTKKGDKYNLLHVDNASNFKSSYPDITTGNVLNSKSSGVIPNKLSFSFYQIDEETNIGRGTQITLENLSISSNGILPKNIGVSMELDTTKHSFKEAFTGTFKDFGRASTLIIRGLGELFSKDGWKNVGGIIAIGVSSTQILQENGFGMFLYFWAIISVNLGIVNLLPFPGLDGWQLLVTIVEGITRKTIPLKIKSIVSAIGIGLLFILMILIIIKDLIMVI